jgi:hypothetical protein
MIAIDSFSFVPNITPSCALIIAATCARRSAIPIRDFLHRYLGREYIFSAFTVSVHDRIDLTYG